MEKPFALTEAQSREIVDLAARAGKQVGVNYLYNYEVPGLALEPIITKGELGEIVHLDTSYGYNLAGDYGLAVMTDPNHWVHRLPGKLFHNVLDHVLAKVVPFLGDEIETRVMAFDVGSSRKICVAVRSAPVNRSPSAFQASNEGFSSNASVSERGVPPATGTTAIRRFRAK